MANRIIPGKNIDLVETFSVTAERAYDHVPVVFYDIVLKNSYTVVGSIDFRDQMNDYMYYYGHVGYMIKPDYRGNGYALEALKLIEDIAKKEYGYKEMIVTCNPDNIASYKTLVKAGYELYETVDVPVSHELYWKNEKRKCIFKHILV